LSPDVATLHLIDIASGKTSIIRSSTCQISMARLRLDKCGHPPISPRRFYETFAVRDGENPFNKYSTEQERAMRGARLAQYEENRR
jgi:hypothetical protein